MLKFLTNDFRRNLIKILCLTLGLSVGFLLIAKVYFEQTYDSFFPDIERLYRVTESVEENGEYREYPQTPGATAVGLGRRIAQIEAATRYTWLTGKTIMKLTDGRMVEVEGTNLADSTFFDVLKTPIIAGDPHTVLSVTDQCMIPRSLAEKIGGDVIGLRMYNTAFGEEAMMTIGGVYEDFPLNSTILNAVYLSMPTIGKYTWDGTDNWIGNDRYTGFVRLAKGVAPEDIGTQVMDILEANVPEDAFKISHYKVWFRPLAGSYSSRPGVRTMSWMLGLLAIVMLMGAALNYLLIVVGQLAKRGKEMAVRKCFGTGFPCLFARVMGESLFFLMLSLGLAVVLLFSLSDLIGELIGYTPAQLLSTPRIWIVIATVIVVLLILTGIVPSVIYARTPVTSAFRPSSGRRGWKLALLAVQFFSTGLLLSLLVLVERQYYYVAGLGMGFHYENIGVCSLNDMPLDKRSALLQELRKLPCVEGVATYNTYAFSQVASGNMMWTEGMYDRQVNIADLEYMNPEMIDVMGVRILEGEGFSESADTDNGEILVEERMVDLLRNIFEVKSESIVGQQLHITGHGYQNQLFTIVGVVGNMRRGGYERDNTDTRAAVLFPSRNLMDRLFIRFTELTPETRRAAQDVIDNVAGGHHTFISFHRDDIRQLREPIRRFGTSVMIVGVAILIISLIGLVGYVADEVNRRAKEIAIRKVNGTSSLMIVRLFCTDILRVALPSLILGGIAAAVIGRRWLAQFTDRVDLSPLSFSAVILTLLVIITVVVVANCLRVSRSNPVEYLRSE